MTRTNGPDASGKVSLIHLGCAKNLVDSETLLALLMKRGAVLSPDPSEADVIIVNTCSFIGPAREESIDAVLDAARFKVEGNCRRLVVAGCLVARYRGELAKELPEVDAFVSVGDIPSIARIAFPDGDKAPRPAGEDYEWSRALATPPGTAYLRLADGCDHTCSFCAIPQIRGRQRSRPIAEILDEARSLVSRGALEITLIAHDTTDYGRDLGLRRGLARLLEGLRKIEGIEWLRILYLYPSTLSDRVISLLGEGRPFLPYFDIPLQHSHPRILASMARGGNVERTVDRIRKRVEGATIRSTLIVGYPGEGEEEFAHLAAFVERTRFDRLGVFCFSEEEGVPASPLCDPVPERVKRQRRRKLMLLQRRISLENHRALVGQRSDCLLLGSRTGRPAVFGRLESQAPEVDGITMVGGATRVPFPSIVPVTITRAGAYDLMARVE